MLMSMRGTQRAIKYIIDLFVILTLVSVAVWWSHLLGDLTSCSSVVYGEPTKLAGNISASLAFVVLVLSQHYRIYNE